MIATDNHLGYQEGSSIRKNDGFLAVEEVLREAVERNCDFLLLGGDLFHDHSPSKYTLNMTMQLFDKYVTGHREVPFETLSADRDFNYLNPSLTIKLPVFIIHGNHDDPASDTNISAISLMHSAHYLNYVTSESISDKVYVKPVVLRKGGTLVAIYGLGNIKEERLSRMLKAGAVIFEEVSSEENCFCILVVHQNRFKGHGLGAPSKNCIMDWAFPDFIDLIVWGHEHDCFLQPRKTENKGYLIYQPGSTLATSLTEGESKIKHMFLLEIKQLAFKMTPIPIKNTRPILFQQIVLQDFEENKNDLEGLILNIFEKSIENINCIQELRPPLVRIKVEVTGHESFRAFYVNSIISERTANKDVVTVWKRNVSEKKESLIDEKSSGIVDGILGILVGSVRNADNEFRIFNAEQFVQAIEDFSIKKDLKAMENLFNAKMEMACRTVQAATSLFDEDVIRRRINNLNISMDATSMKRLVPVVPFEKKSKKCIKTNK